MELSYEAVELSSPVAGFRNGPPPAVSVGSWGERRAPSLSTSASSSASPCGSAVVGSKLSCASHSALTSYQPFSSFWPAGASAHAPKPKGCRAREAAGKTGGRVGDECAWAMGVIVSVRVGVWVMTWV